MTAEDGIAWATLALAIVTAALAVATFLSVREGRAARAEWASMAIEATRSRLDAKAPAVYVRLAQFREPEHVPTSDDEWVLGRGSDSEARITIVCDIEVANDSPRSVNADLVVSPGTDAAGRIDGSTLLLPPGTTPQVLRIQLTVAEWVESYQRRETGKVPTIGYAIATIYDDDDNGVSDIWMFTIRANPLEPVGDPEAGRWRLRKEAKDRHGSLAEPLVRTRTYFVSRAEDVRLPYPPLLEKRLKEKEQEIVDEYPTMRDSVRVALSLASSIVLFATPLVGGPFVSLAFRAVDAALRLRTRKEPIEGRSQSGSPPQARSRPSR